MHLIAIIILSPHVWLYCIIAAAFYPLSQILWTFLERNSRFKAKVHYDKDVRAQSKKNELIRQNLLSPFISFSLNKTDKFCLKRSEHCSCVVLSQDLRLCLDGGLQSLWDIPQGCVDWKACVEIQKFYQSYTE